HGIPCAPVRTITEVAEDRELESRGLLRTGEFSGYGEVKVLGTAIKMSRTAEPSPSPRVPALGEDTVDVLGQLGIGAAEISQLRRDGVI
ncbi:MAG TPA: CoA transferase, partial [Candidatus Binataceae bacterium]|nr:CoA transferase [Candidatus Binataceae bacterium]